METRSRFAKVDSRILIIVGIFFASLQAHSAPASINVEKIPYYGGDFYRSLENGEQNLQLKRKLNWILTSYHVLIQGDFDTITDHCNQESQNCYRHVALSYTEARNFLMGYLFLESHGEDYSIRDVYCEKSFTRHDFDRAPFPGPGVSPNPQVINVEHTWPQSRFSSQDDRATQKADLHHLFPTESGMNSLRSNFEFADVTDPDFQLPCALAKLGSSRGAHGKFFEPPHGHKGNVARALFYFSIRYSLPINTHEETSLRRWHRADPVDAQEVLRHESIFHTQGTRNPFIDFPELSERINDF